MSDARIQGLELGQLHMLAVVVRCGSITAAARSLGVSQPALTQAIRKLEERFGTTLLLRSSRGVTATESGHELLRVGATVLGLIDAVEQRIHGLEHEEVGSFVLGCHESLGAYFLPEFMARFMASCPRIELSLWNGSSASVHESVLRQQLHFGLVVNPLPHPELVITRLMGDAVALFATPELADSPALDTAPLIFAERVTQSRQLLDRLVAYGFATRRLLPCGDMELVKSLTLAGVGIGLLPHRVAAYNAPLRLRRVDPALPSIDDQICLIYRADLHRTRAAMRLKDELVTWGRSLDAHLPLS